MMTVIKLKYYYCSKHQFLHLFVVFRLFILIRFRETMKMGLIASLP